MEEEKENNTPSSEGSNEILGESIVQSLEKVDTQKAMIVVFMITACLCGLIGFYAGMQYITNECDTQYQEFFDTHYCIEGTQPSGNTIGFTIDGFDLNTEVDSNVK